MQPEHDGSKATSSSCVNGVADKPRTTEERLIAMEESYQSVLTRLELTEAEVNE